MTLVRRRILVGGFPPCGIEGVFRNGELEAWRAWQLEDGKPFGIAYIMDENMEEQVIRWLYKAKL